MEGEFEYNPNPYSGGSNGKELACSVGDLVLIPGSGKYPGEGNGWLPTPVFLPGEFHGQRSLVRYSPWDCKKSDTTEQLSFTFYHLNWLRNCFTKTV